MVSTCLYFFFLATPHVWLQSFESLSLSESSPYSHDHFSGCPSCLPASLFESSGCIVRISLLRIFDLCESFFPLCLWLLPCTYSSWNFLKSAVQLIWNVCPEMSSTSFLSSVSSKMTWSLFPVSVTPTLLPSSPLLVRVKF